jgi:hypothetical protein
MIECNICMNEYTVDQMFDLQYNHNKCFVSWTQEEPTYLLKVSKITVYAEHVVHVSGLIVNFIASAAGFERR